MSKKDIGKTLVALVPILVLVGILALNISIFGADSILGASQVALLFSAGICVWLGMWLELVGDYSDRMRHRINR